MEVLPTPCMATIAEYLPQLEHGRLCVWLRDTNRVSEQKYRKLTSAVHKEYVFERVPIPPAVRPVRGMTTEEMMIIRRPHHSNVLDPVSDIQGLKEIAQCLPNVCTLIVITRGYYSPDSVYTPSTFMYVLGASFRSLTSLILSGQFIFTSGEQLQPLSQLITLTELDLYSCVRAAKGKVNRSEESKESSEISRIYPLAELINLQILNLAFCRIGGFDLEPLKTLSKLHTLCLCGTQVESTVGISTLPRLKTLDLTESGVDVEGGLFLPPSVTDLDLAGCYNGGGLHPFLHDVLSLTRLRLDSCRVTDHDLDYLSAFNLQSLSFSCIDGESVITTAGVRSIASFPSLKELSMEDVSLTGAGLDALVESGLKLRSLTTSFATLSVEEFARIAEIDTLRTLEVLWELNTEMLAALCNLRLQKLKFYCDPHDLVDLSCLASMSTLEKLEIYTDHEFEPQMDAICTIQHAMPNCKFEIIA